MQGKDLSDRSTHADVSHTHKSKRNVKKMPNVRRSLTITEDNDEGIQHERSVFLALKPAIDMDYTSMTNLLLELGRTLFESNWREQQVMIDSKRIVIVLAKHCFNASLKDAALGDQIQDWFIQNLPKMLEQYQKTYMRVEKQSC
jgi:hypothetical protein